VNIAWDTPGFAISMALLAFALQGVWVVVKAVESALRHQSDKRENAERRARAAEDSVVLVEVRAIRADIERMNARLESGDAKFARTEQRHAEQSARLDAIERDVRRLIAAHDGTGA